MRDRDRDQERGQERDQERGREIKREVKREVKREREREFKKENEPEDVSNSASKRNVKGALELVDKIDGCFEKNDGEFDFVFEEIEQKTHHNPAQNEDNAKEETTCLHHAIQLDQNL